MPGPTLTFGFVVATLIGAVFHMLVGGDARRLALFLLAGWFGFALGHLLGVNLNVNIFNVGALRFVSAAVGAIVTLLLAHFMTTSRRPVR